MSAHPAAVIVQDPDEHPELCTCHACHEEREAIKDREFDEQVALGYI